MLSRLWTPLGHSVPPAALHEGQLFCSSRFWFLPCFTLLTRNSEIEDFSDERTLLVTFLSRTCGEMAADDEMRHSAKQQRNNIHCREEATAATVRNYRIIMQLFFWVKVSFFQHKGSAPFSTAVHQQRAGSWPATGIKIEAAAAAAASVAAVWK